MPVNRKHFLAGGLFLALLLVWWILRPVVVTEIVSDELPARDQDMLPEAKVAERFRHVRINASAVEAVQAGDQVISLELFPGETVQVRLNRAEKTDPVSTEVHGDVIGQPGATASFITFEGVMAGSVELADGRKFLINYADDEAHSIVELAASGVHSPDNFGVHPDPLTLFRSPDGEVISMPQLGFTPYTPGVTNRVPGFPGFTHVLTLTNTMSTNLWPVPLTPIYGPPIIGVLACYTGLAETQCGGKRGVETRVRISVAQVNNAFRRSAINAKLILLGTEKVNHVTSGNSTTDLVDLTFGATQPLYDVHLKRQLYRADLVSLFTGASPRNIMHGSSWMLNSTNGAPAYGFNVVEAVYAPTSVFVHEIGHNLGCSHATNDVGGFAKGSFTNSHGWKFGITTNGNTYPMRTLMSYGVGRRLGYFSNPNVNVWGVPTGDTNFANNAFTIQQMAPVVGSYFTQIIQTTQLVPNAQPISVLPGTTNRPGIRQPRRIFWGTGE